MGNGRRGTRLRTSPPATIFSEIHSYPSRTTPNRSSQRVGPTTTTMRAIPRVIRIRPPRQALLRRFQSTFPAKPLREIPKYFEREENFRGNAPTRPPALLRPEAEQQWLEYWDALPKKSIFEDPQKPTIRMLLPPPNVTGELHMGHATMLAVQDSLARYYRMNGHKVEWRPGTDHAGIATQGVVERWLAEKNGEMVTRHDLGREGLLKKIEEWREKYGARILEQMVCVLGSVQMGSCPMTTA